MTVLYGGAFDPPHLGHQAVVRTARDQLALDRLLVVPTGQPPHRDASPTPAEDRLQMAIRVLDSVQARIDHTLWPPVRRVPRSSGAFR